MENVKKSRIDNSVLLIPLAGVINADNASAVAQKMPQDVQLRLRNLLVSLICMQYMGTFR